MKVEQSLDALWLDDLDPDGADAAGLLVYGQDVWHRLNTRGGSCIGSEGDGLDLCEYMHNTQGAAELRAVVTAELRKDPRTTSLRVDAFMVSPTAARLEIFLTTDEGDLVLTIGVSGVTVELLNFEAKAN